MGFYQHYEKVVREGEAHELERRHAHARALKESDSTGQARRRWSGIRDSIVALLLRWRPESHQPASRHASMAGPLVVDDHDLTDYVCRLADGSMGRVAIIPGTDEEWTAVCVRA